MRADLAREGKIAAVVLAAGRSVRFASARSKLLHPLGGKPLIEWPLAALAALKADPRIIVVGPGADELRAACGGGVTFAVQKERRGTGHAVRAARPLLRGFEGSVVILNGDLPLLAASTLRALVRRHRRSGAGLTLLTAVVGDPYGWGRIARDARGLRGIVEERDASAEERAVREVNVGVYCVRSELLFSLLDQVRPDNAQKEIYLTDIVGIALRRGIVVATQEAPADEVGQVNSRAELAALEKVLRERTNGDWMAKGVTFLDPATAYVGPDVRIGADTVIGPNVHLRGRTRIGSDCHIAGSSYITDSTVADGVLLRFGVVMTETEVGRHCEIGPFAHLRPGTRLGERVHIGDFVETKNSVLGAGTKANHLAYLGDAEIGSDTNVGAGTITCNYDGFQKHRTVIGDRVQIGSDTQLVAPVRLGDDVYVASGSTVRRDVAAGSLVFNPRQQAERGGWVEVFRRRERSGAAKPAPPARKRRRSG